MKRVCFPFTFIEKTNLGRIYRPYATVFVFSKAREKWQPIQMIIDTGADYTLFPKRYAQILGIDLNLDCRPETTLGVGGAETVYQYKGLLIRIGTWEQRIPVGFLERDDVPPLLGRLNCLEIFKLIFQNLVSVFEKPRHKNPEEN